jgi:diaminopimelate decarboxylase
MTPSSLWTATAVDGDVQRAVEHAGTPLFYYSLGALRAQIARLRAAVSGYPVQLLFATMANDRAEILRAIAGEGVGACVNSMLHLQQVREQGFPAARIQFTSCGVPLDDMRALHRLGIRVNLDSPSQIQAWCGLQPGAVTGARINAACLDGSPAPPDRIGMDLADFARARTLAAQLGGRVNGVHVYAGTNFQSSAEILPILRGILALARRHPDLDYVNIGGGVGVDYSHEASPFDYEHFGAEVCALAREAASGRERPLAVLFEPGRSLVACSGLFVTRVTDIKRLHDTRFVLVDASVSTFPRPFHHPGTPHRARVLGAVAGSGATVPSVVAGRTTFSRDIFGSYHLPAALDVGSLIAFEDAGAYCESMTSRFLGQQPAAIHVAES